MSHTGLLMADGRDGGLAWLVATTRSVIGLTALAASSVNWTASAQPTGTRLLCVFLLVTD